MCCINSYKNTGFVQNYLKIKECNIDTTKLISSGKNVKGIEKIPKLNQ